MYSASKAFQVYSVCLWFAALFTRGATLQNNIISLVGESFFSRDHS